jgi:Uma2 family endonuclease
MIQVLEQEIVSISYEEERGKPMPSYNHGKVQTKIASYLDINYGEKFDILSEISIKIDDWGVTPDVGIFPLQKVDFQHDIVKMNTVPLCAIEILSPTQSLNELTDKVEQFFLKGSKSYWLVIPQFQNIYVYDGLFSYKIYQKNDILKDEKLGIEIDLKMIFK